MLASFEAEEHALHELNAALPASLDHPSQKAVRLRLALGSQPLHKGPESLAVPRLAWILAWKSGEVER